MGGGPIYPLVMEEVKIEGAPPLEVESMDGLLWEGAPTDAKIEEPVVALPTGDKGKGKKVVDKGKGKLSDSSSSDSELPKVRKWKGKGKVSEGSASKSAYTHNDLDSDLDCLNAELDKICINDVPVKGKKKTTLKVEGRQAIDFLEENDEFQKLLAEGGVNASAAVDKWARNRLDKFRVFKGLDTSVPVELLPVDECSDLLTKFFAQIKKTDGSLYPTQTLASLYRAFHRILRRQQEVRIQLTGQDVAPFSMRNSPLFKSVGVSCVLAMERSKRGGANLPQKKSRVITLADEHTILDHPCTNPCHPRGLQARVAFYLLVRFAIRGGQELYNLEVSEFQFGTDEAGPFVRYDERLSKNYKVSLDRYQDEHFRPGLPEHDTDVIRSFQMLFNHLPVNGTFVFYQVIDNPRTQAWFSSLRVSPKRLTGVLKDLHQDCGLETEAITNKSGRTTCVTRMSAEGVPSEIGMRVTGHKSKGAYNRYDRSLEAQVRAAKKCIGEGTAWDENIKKEGELFKEKVVRGDGGDDFMEDSSPIKKPKKELSRESSISECGRQSSDEKEEPLNIKIEVGKKGEKPERTVKNYLPGEEPLNLTEDLDESWMDEVDWDTVMKPWDKCVNVNPITAVFGKIAQMSNCTVNITIGTLSNK